MTNLEMTAVEWLEKQITKFHNWKLNPIYDENCFDEIELNKAINKAKEMEKQQIIEAVNQTDFEDIDNYGICEPMTKGEQYYNEKFKK